MKKTLIYLFVCLFLGSCNKTETEQEIIGDHHAVLVYMVADNNLYPDALKNIAALQKSWRNNYNGKIVVFLDPPNSKESPSLFEIAYENGKNVSKEIKKYPDMNSLDPNNMGLVIDDFIEKYRSSDKFSLIYWSHGSGWYPNNPRSLRRKVNSSIPVKSFGLDGSYQMDIPDLVKAIPDKIFTNIMFDACLMAGVETAYALRDKAEMIVASPAEVIADGFPYAKLTPLFFNDKMDARDYAKAYFDDYNGRVGGYRSATISVVKTSELDNLAKATSKVLARANMSKLNKAKLQDFDNNSFFETVFIDFKDFVNQVTEGPLLDEFNTQLDKTVIYKANTPGKFLGIYPITTCCGLTCYVPESKNTILESFYSRFEWYSKSGFANLSYFQ